MIAASGRPRVSIERQKEMERRRRAEEVRQREQRRVEKLLDQAESWDRSSQLRRFLEACRRATPETGMSHAALEEWLRWAEQTADRIDPLAGGIKKVIATSGP